MNMNKVIENAFKLVKEKLGNDLTGHDYYHSERVWKIALKIAKKEKNVNFDVLQLVAILHDLEDWKLREQGQAEKFLKDQGVEEDIIRQVIKIIKNISYKGAKVESKMNILEGKIVQDADKIDALGAIGIARCFSTGAKLGNPIFDSELKPKLHKSFEEYKNRKTTAINHFYEKLLLLKDKMNTKEGKKIAEKRDKFIKKFLRIFYQEWYF